MAITVDGNASIPPNLCVAQHFCNHAVIVALHLAPPLQPFPLEFKFNLFRSVYNRDVQIKSGFMYYTMERVPNEDAHKFRICST